MKNISRRSFIKTGAAAAAVTIQAPRQKGCCYGNCCRRSRGLDKGTSGNFFHESSFFLLCVKKDNLAKGLI